MAKRGRKPKIKGETTRDTAYLALKDHELIVNLGDGSFTHGVRHLVNFYRDQRQPENGNGRSPQAVAA